MRMAVLAAAVLAVIPASFAPAQHTHGGTPDSAATRAFPPGMDMGPDHGDMAGMQHDRDTMMGMEHEAGHGASSSHPLGFRHGRFGSGTSWLPDATPARHLMTHAGGWTVMGHGAAFAGGVAMNGPRGDRKAFAPHMVMLMAERGNGRTYGRLGTMLSADAATVGGAGYPLLFQTGETWNDDPLHDHQHPHNVVSELSATIARGIGRSAAVTLYAAPVGEPALAGSCSSPSGLAVLAPIGHHWQDATHIAYGVLTAGFETRRWRVEASTFNGREPGENRAAIIGPRFDSASGRLSVNPSPSLAFQVSHGYLHRPESAHPGEDAWRSTASLVWVHPSGERRSFDIALVAGRNRVHRESLDSWLVEGEWDGEDGFIPFARVEYVEKTAEELVLAAPFDPARVFPLRQATLGLIYNLPLHGALSWGIGGQLVASAPGRDLRPVYGSDPGGWSAFLRIRPRAMRHMEM